jgi:hypothetical protein
MVLEKRHLIAKRVIAKQVMGLVFILAFIWVNELYDIPSLIFGEDSTPVNWKGSLAESAFIVFLGIHIINYTKKMFRRMKYIEGILPVCAHCKRIRDEKGQWHEIESYICGQSEAEFTHGLCPECVNELYPEFHGGQDEQLVPRTDATGLKTKT